MSLIFDHFVQIIVIVVIWMWLNMSSDKEDIQLQEWLAMKPAFDSLNDSEFKHFVSEVIDLVPSEKFKDFKENFREKLTIKILLAQKSALKNVKLSPSKFRLIND